MLLACEQVPRGPLGAGTGESPFCSPPSSQSSPEKLLAGYVTGREDSKREWKFVLELDKHKQRWRNFTCCVG